MQLFDSRVDWDAFFASATLPHNADDHLVAADYYEERGEEKRAEEHRRLARYWAWVRREGIEPCNYSYPQLNGFGVEQPLTRRPKQPKELHPTAEVPEEVFDNMPVDDIGDFPAGCVYLLYETQYAAYMAVYEGWCKSIDKQTTPKPKRKKG